MLLWERVSKRRPAPHAHSQRASPSAVLSLAARHWCIAGVVWLVWVFCYVLLTKLVSGLIAEAAWRIHRHMAPQLAQKLPALPRLKARAIGWSDAHLRIATPARYYMHLPFNFAGQRVPTPAASPRPNHPTADSSMFRPVG
jgi:hypothetical protein